MADTQKGLPLAPDRTKVAGFLPEWLETVRDTLKPKTIESYKMIVRRHLAPALGKHPLTKLEPQHIHEYMRGKLEQGLSPRTVQYHHAVLRSALGKALKWGLAARNVAKLVDPPAAALLKDLKQRGLLEETLVVWMGEFGRTPDNGIRGGIKYGRDHNPNAMNIWLAGGGVKAGHTIGATDEIGATAVEVVHPLRDFHVTLLRLLGLDDNKLTYYHAGRFKQLSQFGGKVINELIA